MPTPPLIKNRWVAVPVVIVVVLAFLWVVSDPIDKAIGATAGDRTSARCMNDDPEISCLNKAKTLKTKFVAGKMGNSKGLQFSPKSIKKIKKSIAAKQSARLGYKVPVSKIGCDWWCYPIEAAECMAYGLNMAQPKTASCEKSKEHFDEAQDEYVKFGVKCGGSAVIAYYLGGPVGIGTGAATCLYSQLLADW